MRIINCQKSSVSVLVVPMSSGDCYFIEKANGIEYLYAWLDKHPYVRAVVTSKTRASLEPLFNFL